MTDLPLTKLSETASTITLGWTPPAGAAGYLFWADAKRSSTLDGSRSTVKFAKGAAKYRVQALGIVAEGSYPSVAPPSPPVTGNGRSAIRYSSSMYTGTAALSTLDTVAISRYAADAAATVVAKGTSTKTLMYCAVSDSKDEGTGSTIPSQAIRFATNGSSVTYNEALAWDVANPADKWVLRDSGGNPIRDDYGRYHLDLGKKSYRAQWLSRTLEQFAAQPQWRGVFIDNVVAERGLLNAVPVTPTSYPTDASWEAAMSGFITTVMPELTSRGYYVMLNMNKFIGGDSRSDTGELLQGWCASLGSALSGNCAMFIESGWRNTSTADEQRVRLNAASWMDYWLGWGRDMMAAISSTGVLPWIALSNSVTGDPSSVRYARASTMMFWDGRGGFEWSSGANWDLSLNPSFTFSLGQPLATYAVDANGCYTRQFANGWVACNPTASSRTVIVGGKAKTIPSGDGFIGVP